MKKNYRNEKPEMGAREYELVNSCREYVLNLAKRYYCEYVSNAEVESEALTLLCEAAPRYRGDNGAQFQTYVHDVVTNGLLAFVQKERLHGGSRADEEEIMEHYRHHSQVPPLGYENRQMVNVLLDRLTDEEREVMQMYYGLVTGDPMTMEEIGDVMGCSKATVYRRIQEIFRKMGMIIKQI